MNIFSIKYYFRANLKIDVTKSRIFRGISKVKLKSEIHSPGNFLLVYKHFPVWTETPNIIGFHRQHTQNPMPRTRNSRDPEQEDAARGTSFQ